MSLLEFIKQTDPFIQKLLDNYEPVYRFNWPITCEFCGKGPCSLTNKEDRGICGLNPEAVLARDSLSQVTIGMNTHLSSLERMINYSRSCDFRVQGEGVTIPITRTLLNSSPSNLKEVQEVYQELLEIANQISSLLHMGQESDSLEFEKWSLTGGLVDLLSLELAELIYNSIQPELNQVKRVSYGPQTVERKKPNVLIIGHLPPVLEEIIKEGRNDEGIELLGLCCLGHEASRTHPEVKFVGSLNQQVKVVSSGIADVVVVDEQCVMPNLLEAAKQSQTKIICVSPKIRYKLENLTEETTEKTIKKIINNELPGAVILDEEKAAKTSIQLAKKIHNNKRPNSKTSLDNYTLCGACEKVCPKNIELTQILENVKDESDFEEELSNFWNLCIECRRCERVCPQDVRILGGLTEVWCETQVGREIKSGRGAISDDEIRVQAPSLVLGSIPGTIIFTGCPEFPGGTQEIGELVQEFTENNYIVLSAGCSAAALAETGTFTESYRFEPATLINLGSCFSNSHTVGSLIKAAHYQALIDVDGNYRGVADFILNKLSSCCVLWGIVAPKTYAAAHGAIAFGVPVIIPSKPAYKKSIRRRNEKIKLYDEKWDREVEVEHTPDHLLYIADNLNDCLLSTVRLCMRPSDTASSRRKKLEHLLDLNNDRLGGFSENAESFVRTSDDIPKRYQGKLKGNFKNYIPDTTLLRTTGN
ncbi:hypothetical protein AKJ53_00445 [candidate division MSBL1 archaeon SCGC-AAA382F02]|uniref:4Fe-4S ferredoxin-type domain-containing protein n=1 Tax=candidate division MSBL1 archaeon SCGC-AAA382F02 TaxID=1698282 RepID=A0A133VIZ1_9EURY|nr:hypothetical protein AKJ53_00445 [candidate division MSBL1 archaeon SCGC-AAA382F02]